MPPAFLPLLLLAAPAPARPDTLDAFFERGERPRVIAHRGASAEAPENTLAAGRRAIELGVDMVEVDVGRTADGAAVVIHDSDLGRTTNGKGRLAETTLEQLRELDAGAWFGDTFAGETVPTLAEVLELARGQVLLNLEIKPDALTEELAGGFVEHVVETVRASRMERQVLLSCFDPRGLEQARALAPEIARATLLNREFHRNIAPGTALDAVGARAFHLHRKQLTENLVKAVHAAGRPIAVYTVNDRHGLRRVVEMGVDAIFTDRPGWLLELLEAESF